MAKSYTEFMEGLYLPPDIARQLSASVASGSKGKIIPSVGFINGKTEFSYTDKEGKKHHIMTLDRIAPKTEVDKTLKMIAKKYSEK